MRRLDAIDWIAVTLTVIGAINWGLIGIFRWNLVETLFGTYTTLTRIVYTLVGVSGLYLIYTASKMSTGVVEREDRY